MKVIKAKVDFNYGGNFYTEGEEITDKFPVEVLNRLNEKGYIEPLSIKDITEYSKELNNKVKEEK